MVKHCLVYFNKNCRHFVNDDAAYNDCSTFVFNDHIDEGKFINVKSNYNRVPNSFKIDYGRKDSYWNFFTIWAKNNHFDYYWVVDEGSYFNGNIYNLIDKYAMDSSDLIAHQIKGLSSSWYWFNSKRSIQLNNESDYKSAFISTCRFSRKLIECGYESLSQNKYAYLEIFWPTICHMKNLKCKAYDESDIGDFEWKNDKAYILQPSHIDNKLYYGIKRSTIIPKIIHKTSVLSKDEIFACKHFKKLANLHPEYSIKYYTDDDVEAYMKKHFNYDNIYEAFSNVSPWAYKIDVFRLCVLYKEGGIYSDIGHDMMMSFNTIIDDGDFILCLDQGYYGRKGYIHNALMCSYPKNELFKIMLDTIVENIMNQSYCEDALSVTGPGALRNSIDIRNGYIKYTQYGQCKILHLQRKSIFKDIFIGHILNRNILLLVTKCEDYATIFGKQQGDKHYNWLWKNKEVFSIRGHL